MSLHRSFLSGRSGGRHRNVLSRVERLDRLEKEGRWNREESSVYGLSKVGHRKMITKKKKKEKAEGETADAAAPAKK